MWCSGGVSVDRQRRRQVPWWATKRAGGGTASDSNSLGNGTASQQTFCFQRGSGGLGRRLGLEGRQAGQSGAVRGGRLPRTVALGSPTGDGRRQP
ncbi:hypothetical protein PR202_gb11645 [Eleusine coracana subsp. coracana]|uniref:Uncharacterized protein n=1 Tax=Eleusine coracana subsp. coracana TaxID=191504 RepID=A0AAV5EN22_ELECO|nr:hypothetical protein PR202_gb11645 [Eleusine coracana subsp. coracana]